MTKRMGLVAMLVLAGWLASTTTAGATCQTNCAKLFQSCKQGCVENYSGRMRRVCKIGCRRAKAAATRVCRRNPQVCPDPES